MADTPSKIVVDCSTGETVIEPLTAEEIAQREADGAAWLAQQAAEEAAKAEKAEAKQALLDRLGITAEEAALLLS